MNTNILEGKWKQFTGEFKQQWNKLTDDEIDQAAGERREFIGLLQEKYGWAQEKAEREFDNFVAKLND